MTSVQSPKIPPERDVDLRIAEVIAVRERHARQGALAGEGGVGHFTEHDLHREPRRGEERRAVHRAAERARELGVRHRMRRGDVDGSADRRRVHDPPHHLDPVQPVHPGHVLASRSDRAAGEEAERPHHLRKGAAGFFEHEPGAQQHDPPRGLAARLRLRFPFHAEVRQEVVARRGLLAERLGAAIAVDADGAAADERGRRVRRLGERRHQGPGGEDPAVAQRLLAGRGPAPVGDGFAGEVDEGRRAVELPREVPRMSVRVPADTGNAGFAGAGLVLRLAGRERPRQDADVVPLLGPRPGEGAAEKPGAAGNDHFHRVCWTSGVPRKFAGYVYYNVISLVPFLRT